ncbi:hypothetical protein HMPREF9447_05032 [Bacteroides oleiciplenus YIT 12058]|uniref:RagB/SusD domain-containing protein n=2 Tax=Bacteroides oleiciplenus TaxID=626931 RepID=K9DSZ8_9BACE|nr:hypothetical protein HMPREF9447_05032 [Bacteroides oleiciplenus YIT 12058]
MITNMKKIIYTVSLTLFLVVTSCTLERESYTEINTEMFPQTETDVELAVNALYYYYNTGTWNKDALFAADRKGWISVSEFTAGTLWTGWGGQWDKLYFQQWTAGDTPAELSTWYSRYNVISRCRNTIRTLEKVNLSRSVLAPYIAEVKALRGMMALFMYDFFGPVPIASDEVLDNPEIFVYLPQATDEEYDAMMESDLRDAIADLPEKAEIGRMTKGTAMMILLKYYMIRGKYSEAEILARQIYSMEKSVYSLLDNPSNVFDFGYLDNNEVIYRLSGNLNATSTYQNFTAECLPGDFPFGTMTGGWSGYLMPIDVYETFENGDLRMNCLYPSYINNKGEEKKGWYDENGKWTGDNSQLQLGVIALKYGPDHNSNNSTSANNLIIYRFSDVILTLAECITRNQKAVTNEAITLVNRIRNRAGLANLDAVAISNYDIFMEALFMERIHELFHEGHARQDEIRFGKFTTFAKKRAVTHSKTTQSVEGTYNRFPIPETYITESKGAIRQNSGY